MRSKKLRTFLLALLLVILAPLILLEGISIYSYLRFRSGPSATEKMLVFAELPQDTKLPTREPNATNAYNTEYQQVQESLTQRFPNETARQEIEQYTTKQLCTAGLEGIICRFEGVWYSPGSSAPLSPIGFLAACSDTVYVTFSFDKANKLAGIEIVGATNCI